jgi:hypothetical protein
LEVSDNEFKDGSRKHLTISELIVTKETSEKYIVLYSIEKRERAYITKSYIFKFNSEF